jgi:hypothetical protein
MRRAEDREEKPDRSEVSIVRTWGAAVLCPYMDWTNGEIFFGLRLLGQAFD